MTKQRVSQKARNGMPDIQQLRYGNPAAGIHDIVLLFFTE